MTVPATAVPFVRTIKLGSEGPDVLAVKRALVKWNKGVHVGVTFTRSFGSAAAALLKGFQAAHHLTADGVYGSASHTALTPYFDAYGKSLLAEESRALLSAKRTAFVAELRRFNAERIPKHYGEVRPMNLTTSDCSGSITLAAKAAGCPDPNGLGFNGLGYTGTMLDHCAHITRAALRPGDLVVFGPGTGHHVVAVLGVGADPLVFSHGHEGDPEIVPLSVQAGNQPTPSTYLSFLP